MSEPMNPVSTPEDDAHPDPLSDGAIGPLLPLSPITNNFRIPPPEQSSPTAIRFGQLLAALSPLNYHPSPVHMANFSQLNQVGGLQPLAILVTHHCAICIPDDEPSKAPIGRHKSPGPRAAQDLRKAYMGVASPPTQSDDAEAMAKLANAVNSSITLLLPDDHGNNNGGEKLAISVHLHSSYPSLE